MMLMTWRQESVPPPPPPASLFRLVLPAASSSTWLVVVIVIVSFGAIAVTMPLMRVLYDDIVRIRQEYTAQLDSHRWLRSQCADPVFVAGIKRFNPYMCDDALRAPSPPALHHMLFVDQPLRLHIQAHAASIAASLALMLTLLTLLGATLLLDRRQRPSCISSTRLLEQGKLLRRLAHVEGGASNTTYTNHTNDERGKKKKKGHPNRNDSNDMSLLCRARRRIHAFDEDGDDGHCY